MLEAFFQKVPFEQTRWGVSNKIMQECMPTWPVVPQPIIEMDWKSMQKIGLRVFIDHAMRALAEVKNLENIPLETPIRQASFEFKGTKYIALLMYASDERGSPPAYQFMFKHFSEQTPTQLTNSK